MKQSILTLLTLILYATVSAQAENKAEKEVWQRELQYWDYVKNNDIPGYLSLWHNSFIGYRRGYIDPQKHWRLDNRKP